MSEEEKNDGLAVVDEDSNVEVGEECEYADIRRQVKHLRGKVEEGYWSLGVILEEVYSKDLYRKWGFESWQEYVEQEVDFGIRKAQYLLKLQEWFDTMTPAVQGWMKQMGWTKARMLMHVITQENAQEWRNRVEGKTVAQIEAMLKNEKSSGSGDGGGDGTGSKDKDNESRKFSATLMGTQYDTVMSAIENAKEKGDTEKDGQALTLICVDYLATNTNVEDRGDILATLEKLWGLKIIAIRPSDSDDEEDDVVYGADFIEEQAAKEKSDDDEDEETEEE